MDTPQLTSVPKSYKSFLIDLAIYIPIMFLIREIYFSQLNFIANGLFWSLTTLIIASWRMYVRKITWKDLGLKRDNFLKTITIAIGICIATVVSIIIFEIIKDQLPFNLAPDTSSENAITKFGSLKGNWPLFFTIIPFIWLESALEELLDRGFLMNWIEQLFSSTKLATALAVIFQACIFGFRHSYDLSTRSITTGLIGLIMGISYVKFGRNLWPLVIAHCLLNTISMINRV